MDRIEKLHEMLEASPEDCFLMHALALEYVKAGNIEKALSYFEKVIETDYKYVGTYYHLAKAYEKTRQFAKAIDAYEKGIQVAHALQDRHAKNELQMALDEITE
jgi:pentatricopeptide repeat protein